MQSRIYKLHFKGEAHFGGGTLDQSESVFMADTLFSALSIEALRCGRFEELLDAVKGGSLMFTDALPFRDGRLYLPKPVLKIERSADADPSVRKQYKKLAYIASDIFKDYLNGSFSFEKNGRSSFGVASSRTKAAVRNGTDDTLPYHVGTFMFDDGCGLYVLARGSDSKALELADSLFKSLAFSGIGGKRSAGLGRFELSTEDGAGLEKTLASLCQGDGQNRFRMLLSCALPQDGELDAAMDGASYLMCKRSGFAAPDEGNLLKKRDLCVFAAGSCFRNAFKGGIYDVAKGHSHPVYRYAVPFFCEVHA